MLVPLPPISHLSLCRDRSTSSAGHSFTACQRMCTSVHISEWAYVLWSDDIISGLKHYLTSLITPPSKSHTSSLWSSPPSMSHSTVEPTSDIPPATPHSKTPRSISCFPPCDGLFSADRAVCRPCADAAGDWLPRPEHDEEQPMDHEQTAASGTRQAPIKPLLSSSPCRRGEDRDAQSQWQSCPLSLRANRYPRLLRPEAKAGLKLTSKTSMKHTRRMATAFHARVKQLDHLVMRNRVEAILITLKITSPMTATWQDQTRVVNDYQQLPHQIWAQRL